MCPTLSCRVLWSSVGVLTLHLWAAPFALWAGPPKVESLFPAGGQAGTTVEVSLQGQFDPWPVQFSTTLPGATITPAAGPGKLAIALPAELPPGLYWFRAWNEAGAANARPFLVGPVAEQIEVEPNDRPGQAQAMAPGPLVINGRFEPRGDVDVFAVTLRQGETLVAALTAHNWLGSPADSLLQVLNAEGIVLQQNDDDQGLDPLLTFSAPADGDYRVRCFCFPAMADATVALSGGPGFIYRLHLSTGPMADALIPRGVNPLAAAEFQITGWNIPAGGLRFPATAPAGELWTLAIPATGQLQRVPLCTGDVVQEAEPPADPAPPQSLAVPAVLTGSVRQPRETDVFRFSVQAGEVRHVRLFARTLFSQLDPVLEIRDLANKVLIRQDDAPESRDVDFVWTAPAAGEYRLAVSDLYGRGGPRFTYVLSLAAPEANFRARVAGETFTVAPGGELSIPVTIERLNGFAHPVEFTLVGAPAGVTADPVTSEPQGGSAKAITLKLRGGSEPAAGPFRIVGRYIGTAPDAPPRERFTTAPAAGGTLRDELWLTVVK